MSPEELEAELPRLDDPSVDGPVSAGLMLEMDEALAYRDAGNLPDAFGRTLRLVLRATGTDPEDIARRRVVFEPDYQEAPTWRRAGSKPVNVIPLHSQKNAPSGEGWWEDPAMAALEAEWLESGSAAGVVVPGEYRSFVFKTVVALRSTGKRVTAAAIADSIARWVPPDAAEEIRTALLEANA